MARRINAPGIEINEIDRSSYEETVDNSRVGTATLVFGFADKGEDYGVRWMNTTNTFTRTYGQPTNDAEKYFYNAVDEVVSRGGVCYAAKLPYDNLAKDKFTYTSYTIDSEATEISSVGDVIGNISLSDANSKDLLFYPRTISGVWETLSSDKVSADVDSEMGFIEYVKKMCNFNADQSNLLDGCILSSPWSRRNFTYILQDILGFDGTTPGENISAVLSPSDFRALTEIKNSIIDAFEFGVGGLYDSEKMVSDIVDNYVGTLYLGDI